MIFHGSIGAALSFLAGTSDDRIRTLLLNEINGRAMLIPKRLCPVVFKCLLLHCRKSVVLWQNLLDFLPEKMDPTFFSFERLMEWSESTMKFFIFYFDLI